VCAWLYSHIRQLQFAFRQKVLQQGSASSPDIYIYLKNSLIIHEENTKEIMGVKESVYPGDLDTRKSTGTSCQIEIHFMIKTTEYLL
jgi:hypothetical protein